MFKPLLIISIILLSAHADAFERDQGFCALVYSILGQTAFYAGEDGQIDESDFGSRESVARLFDRSHFIRRASRALRGVGQAQKTKVYRFPQGIVLGAPMSEEGQDYGSSPKIIEDDDILRLFHYQGQGLLNRSFNHFIVQIGTGESAHQLLVMRNVRIEASIGGKSILFYSRQYDRVTQFQEILLEDVRAIRAYAIPSRGL